MLCCSVVAKSPLAPHRLLHRQRTQNHRDLYTRFPRDCDCRDRATVRQPQTLCFVFWSCVNTPVGDALALGPVASCTTNNGHLKWLHPNKSCRCSDLLRPLPIAITPPPVEKLPHTRQQTQTCEHGHRAVTYLCRGWRCQLCSTFD